MLLLAVWELQTVWKFCLKFSNIKHFNLEKFVRIHFANYLKLPLLQTVWEYIVIWLYVRIIAINCQRDWEKYPRKFERISILHAFRGKYFKTNWYKIQNSLIINSQSCWYIFDNWCVRMCFNVTIYLWITAKVLSHQ